MSELSAILLPRDKVTLASWLIETYQSRFVVDDNLPEISEISRLDAISTALLSDLPRTVFVLSPCWSSLPLYKAPGVNMHKGLVHYIMQRYGGPAFVWVPGNVLRDRSPPAISAGLLGC